VGVTAVLTQQRGRMPQRRNRLVGPRQRPVRREQGTPVDGCMLGGLAGQIGGGPHALVVVDAVAAQGGH